MYFVKISVKYWSICDSEICVSAWENKIEKNTEYSVFFCFEC